MDQNQTHNFAVNHHIWLHYCLSTPSSRLVLSFLLLLKFVSEHGRARSLYCCYLSVALGGTVFWKCDNLTSSAIGATL